MKNKFLNALVIALIVFQAVSPISALAYVGTDQPDYTPGSVVTIFGDNSDGAGFQAGETVHIDVSGPNGYAATCDPVADTNGAWSCQVTLWASLDAVGDYSYIATGQTSGISQSGTFTDANPNSIVTVTASPAAAIGGTFIITRVQSSSGNTQVSGGTTTQTFGGVQPSSDFSITNIQSPVNGCTYSGSSTVNGTAGIANTTTTVTLQYTCGKTDQTISFGALSNKTYGAADFGVSAIATSGLAVSFTASGDCTVSVSTVHLTGAGSCTITAHQTGNGSYNPAPDVPQSFYIARAPVTATAGSGSATYDGAIHSPSACAVTGVYTGDLACSNNPVSVGPGANTYAILPVVSGTGLSNFDITLVNGTYIIDQASVTAMAGSGSGTYNGSTQSPSACAVTGTYTGDLTCANNPAVVGPDAGTTAIAPVVSGTGLSNFDITLVNGSYIINQASSTTTITCPPSVTYNGSSQTPCSASVTGAGGLSLTPAPSYSNNTNAGTATASYIYAGDLNHTGSSDSKTFEIKKAPVTATAGSGSGTYNGSTQAPSACVISGVYTGDLTCANSPASVGPDAGTTAIAPVVAGTGLSNFDITLVNGSFKIDKAPVTATAGSGSVTYDAATHSPSACVVTGSYTGDLSCANSPASVGPDAGTTAIAPEVTGTGLTNFDITLINGSFTIEKANATCSVTGYSVIFDNTAHTATGSCTGVLGESLSGLNLSGTTHTAVGTYTDLWSFVDITGNYNNANGTVTDRIAAWTLNGFFQPVDMGVNVWNTVKGGSTVPFKFEIFAGTLELTNILDVSSFVAVPVHCPSGSIITDAIEFTTTGGTSLRYDAVAGQFINNWQTPKKPGACYEVTMTTLDGSTLSANFILK